MPVWVVYTYTGHRYTASTCSFPHGLHCSLVLNYCILILEQFYEFLSRLRWHTKTLEKFKNTSDYNFFLSWALKRQLTTSKAVKGAVVSGFPITFNTTVTLFYWLHFPVTAFQLPFKCPSPTPSLSAFAFKCSRKQELSNYLCVCACTLAHTEVEHLSKIHIPKWESWPHIGSGCGALSGYDFNNAGILCCKERGI